MLGTGDGGQSRDGLAPEALFDGVHRHRGGGRDTLVLPGDDRQGSEGAAFVLTLDLVMDRLVRPALSREQRVHGLHFLVRAGEAGCPDELAQQLAPEHSVVGQPLIPPLETLRRAGDVVGGGLQVEAAEKIAPQVRHDPSVSEFYPSENIVLTTSRRRARRSPRSPRR